MSRLLLFAMGREISSCLCFVALAFRLVPPLIFAFYARRLQLLPFQRHVYLSFDFSSFLHVIVRLV